jgi:hypothetical protein
MKNKFTISLFYILVFLTGVAHSQSTSDTTEKYKNGLFKANAISTFNIFREPSYILFGSGLGNLEPLVFESDVIPYFMLSLSQNVRWGVELSPRVIMRMYNQASHPVRTPSFMPKVTFFFQFVDREHGKRDFFSYVSWMHHSNGQEDGFFNPDTTTINLRTGSFYTNWVEGGVFLSRPNAKLLFNTNYVKLFTAYSYSQAPELKGTYGRLRFFINVNSTVKLSKLFRTFRKSDDVNKNYIFEQSIRLGWITGDLIGTKTIDKKRFTFNYRLSFKPTFLKDVNVFVHYYYGQDYYNIHYGRQLSVIRFGISSKANILF